MTISGNPCKLWTILLERAWGRLDPYPLSPGSNDLERRVQRKESQLKPDLQHGCAHERDVEKWILTPARRVFSN